MAALLFSKTGEMNGERFPIDNEASVGRSSGNTILLDSEHISGSHARIYFDAEKESYLIEDLDSSNGTQVDSVDVNGAVRLDSLNVITFAGRYDFIFTTGGEMDPKESIAETMLHSPAESAPELPKTDGAQTRLDAAAPPLPGVLAGDQPAEPEADGNAAIESEIDQTRLAAGMPSLPLPDLREPDEVISDSMEEAKEHSEGHSEGLSERHSEGRYVLTVSGLEDESTDHPLSNGEYVVGRSDECEICIEDGSLSRKHASIRVQNGSVTITDLGSKNGTYVNEASAASSLEAKPGDEIKFGYRISARLQFRED